VEIDDKQQSFDAFSPRRLTSDKNVPSIGRPVGHGHRYSGIGTVTAGSGLIMTVAIVCRRKMTEERLQT